MTRIYEYEAKEERWSSIYNDCNSQLIARRISGNRFHFFPVLVLLEGLTSLNPLEPSKHKTLCKQDIFSVPNMQSLRPYKRSNESQIRKDKIEKSANHDKEINCN